MKSDPLSILLCGVVEVIQREELADRLGEGRRLRVKCGFDPTAPDLHLGHTVLLQKMRQFQDLGHEVIFLIGDFTAMIGDPSGRAEARPPLTREQVAENARTYERQVFKILDKKKTRIEFNSRWMREMTPEDFIRLAGQYSVARLLERDDFQQRFREGIPIGVHELLYPLIQGFDSVALAADMELGGTDQKFNLLVGRELQRAYGQPPQVVMTLPLLEGTDGARKMSKSFGNAIALEDPPGEIFGKIMSLSDALMLRYYELLTDRDLDAVRSLPAMEAKAGLAEFLVRTYHDEKTASAAKADFEKRFRRREFPEDAEVICVESEQVPLVDLLVLGRLAASRSDARRLIEQGAVEVDGAKILLYEERLSFPPGRDVRIKVGKRRFAVARRG